MKKWALAAMMLILALSMASCGAIVVEDSEPVIVGETEYLQKEP